MSWTDLQYPRAGAMKRTGVRVALRNHGNKSLRVVIAIPDLILARLGWKRGDKVAVKIGGGEHAGLISLRRSDIGYVIGTSGTGKHEVKQVVLPAAWAGLPKSPRPSSDAAHQIVGVELIVELPTWAAVSRAPAPAAAPAPQESSSPKPPLDPKWAAAMKGKSFGGKVRS